MRRLAFMLVVVIGMLVTAPGASADVPLSGDLPASGVLVRHDNGYIMLGQVRAADSGAVVATIRGEIIEETTGFNSCPDDFLGCGPFGSGYSATCNILGGDFTVNIRGEQFTFAVGRGPSSRFHLESSLCAPPAPIPPGQDPNAFLLGVDGSLGGQIGGGVEFVEISAPARQISPTVFAWSGSARFTLFTG